MSEIVHFAQLWSVKEKADKLVFYDERMVVVRRWPASTVSDAWSFGGLRQNGPTSTRNLRGTMPERLY